jgi:membrane carboxypeptidase/penicillin-binding protein
LQIHTTLDPTLQKEAVDSIGEALYASDDPSGAAVSVEPQNGAIRALAGQQEDFNLALDARRQPGSAFKPFVLATALKEFVSLESTYYTSRSLSPRLRRGALQRPELRRHREGEDPADPGPRPNRITRSSYSSPLTSV